MTSFRSFFPFTDLAGYNTQAGRKDLIAAISVTFLAVPQGVAYAVIAGLPPAMGLYATAIPTLVGALFRSSKHVMTGPSNAVSLLVAGGVALLSDLPPMEVGVTLALMVGTFQFLAGALRLGSIVDYISNPVVLGYITGAGLLIGVGQLPSVTETPGIRGDVADKLLFWFEGLGGANSVAVAMALGTALLILVLRKVNKNIPGAIVVLTVATILSYTLNLQSMGLRTVADLSPVPSGMPPFTMPSFDLFPSLFPIAIACAMLSLAESSAVARAIALQTGQRLDISVEFSGQGIANISTAFFGGYPTSGSLSRSALNHKGGAVTRMSGVYSGALMLLVLLVLGPLVNHTPIAALAGLLVVVAIGLVDMDRIRLTLRSTWGDRLAFLITLAGTWVIDLDKAIYLGVAISLVLFLRRSRVLLVQELSLGIDGEFWEKEEGEEEEGEEEEGEEEEGEEEEADGKQRCKKIRILQIEGQLFFGAVGEFQTALDKIQLDEEMQVLILRLKRAQGMDITVATMLASMAERLSGEGRTLLLAGVRPDIMKVLEQTGLVDAIDKRHIFPSQSKWFGSMKESIAHARSLVQEDSTALDEPNEPSEEQDLKPALD